jgi:hypothetical protein
MFCRLTGFVLAAALLSGPRIQAFQPPAGMGAKATIQQGLRGDVKSVQVERSDAGDGSRTLVERSIFDRNGRMLEYAHLTGSTPYPVSYQVIRNIYDSQDRIQGIDMSDVSSLEKGVEPTSLQHHTYKFDPQGRCIAEETVDSDGESEGSTIYEYDSRGDLTRETEYSSAGGPVFGITDRTYGPDHRLLTEKTRSNRSGEEGMLDYLSSREHRYDAQGNETETISYEQGVPERRWMRMYDERRRLISSEVILSDPANDRHTYGYCWHCSSSSGRTIYKYDSNDRIIEERIFQPDDQLVGLNLNSYDDHGNCTREWVYQFGPFQSEEQNTRLQLDGIDRVATWTNGLPTYVFSYDSRGNWIKKVTSIQTGGPDPKRRILSLAYRTIEYY